MRIPTGLLTVMLLGATACVSRQKLPAPSPTACAGAIQVQGSGYLGVVFPPECGPSAIAAVGVHVAGYWLPTKEMIAKAEAQLRPALDQARQRPSNVDPYAGQSRERAEYTAAELDAIVDKLSRYRRQYLGIRLEDGSQRVIINFFPAAEAYPPGTRDDFEYWTRSWVTVEDGGNWYWQIQYDVGSESFKSFQCNGNA